MNYSTLVQAIKDYTENEEATFVSQIGNFIEFAELRILREADLNVARKYATSTLTAGDTYLSLPTDIAIIRSMQIIVSNVRTYLQQKDTSFVNEYIGDRTTTGTPRYYAHQDHDTASVVPAPGSDMTIELSYTYIPAGLSASTTTTWIGDNAPQALLYGCLLEASMFMKSEAADVQGYEARYGQALQALLVQEDMRNRTDEYRDRSIKIGDK